jgi:TolB-like protein/DNA-binding winged helix-turn-helix (wHTH) protein/tetratricopeptide (TPR) repeat protein
VAHVYRFDDVQIDVQDFRLFKAGKVLLVEPKALNLLIFLVKNRGRMIGRRELIDGVWGDAFVTDHVLNRAIGQLRKLLVDDAKDPRYIETVPTLGYRFIADVEEVRELAGSSPPDGGAESLIQSVVPADAQPHGPPSVGKMISVRPSRMLQRVAIPLGVGAFVFVGLFAFWIEGRAGRTSGAYTPIRSLAVLPLENLAGDASQEYLADGMTDELTTDLGQVGALRVISNTTARQYRNAHKSLPQIAKELNVDAVVEGSVSRSGDQIRIVAQLVDAPDDKQLWARSYEGDLRGIFSLENQVAAGVAEEVRIQLTPNEQARLTNASPVNPRAYEALLKGYFFERSTFEQNTPQTEWKSLQYFRQAARLDPKFARAYVGIARAYNFLADTGVPTGEATAASDAAVAEALALDPNLGEAYTERAWTLLVFHWDLPAAEADFRRALELDPGASTVHEGLATYFVAMGKFNDGLREIKNAENLDPLSPRIRADDCQFLYLARHYDDALAACNAALELSPNFAWALGVTAEIYERKGMFSEAHKFYAKVGCDPANLALAGDLGCDASSMAIEDQLHGAPRVPGAFDVWLKAQKGPPDAYSLSEAYASLGRKDEAFAWLKKAYVQGGIRSELLNTPIDPGFDPLRSDPRFNAFLRRAGLPPQPRDVVIGPDRSLN